MKCAVGKKFRSGLYSEPGNQEEVKEEPKITSNKANKIEYFEGTIVKDSMSISSMHRGNIKVLSTGSLRISGACYGDIELNGGEIRISGNYNGTITMNSGSLRISGNANGTLIYTSGDIRCSGTNNLRRLSRQ